MAITSAWWTTRSMSAVAQAAFGGRTHRRLAPAFVVVVLAALACKDDRPPANTALKTDPVGSAEHTSFAPAAGR